ncbi:hypothetical protein JCM3775_000855, partial [Rhodotorula graminis]
MVQVAGPPSPPPPSASSRDRLLGTLVCIVLRAKNLPNKARIGKQNPYCTIQYGLHKKRTATIERGGQQPEWDAEFRFEVPRDDLASLDGDDDHHPPAHVTRDGGVLPSSAASTTSSSSTLAKLDKARPVVPPLATGYPPNRRVLRIACWADDARDPKLIGEGELDFEATVKSGKFDDWVQLSRKARYAGEVYLELTWYSNEPRPAQSPRKASLAAASAYGGAGSRVEGPSGSDDDDGGARGGDDDDARTEEWDGGSQVGLSAPMGARTTSQGSFRSASGPPAELSADYPDADLAPLTSSFSTLSMAPSHRPPLPQPPAPRHVAASPYPYPHDPYAAYRPALPEPSTSTAPYGVAPTPNPYGHDLANREGHASGSPAASSFGPGPGAPYSHPHPHPHPHQSPAPPQGPYGAYPPPPSLGEFGQYPGAQQQQQQHRPMGEFEQLAHEHYAGQGYSSASPHYAPPLGPPLPPPSSAAPPFQPYPSSLPPAPVPPTPQPPYPYPHPHPHPQPHAHSHSVPPPAAPYQLPQPPVPPIPPTSSPYWTQPYPPPQQQQQQQQHALPHASSYPSLSHPAHAHGHAHAQYGSPAPPSSAPPFPQPPPPPPPGSFAPPPSLGGTFSPPPPPSLRGQGDYPSIAAPPQPPLAPPHAPYGA